jgi:hypothetical protein
VGREKQSTPEALGWQELTNSEYVLNCAAYGYVDSNAMKRTWKIEGRELPKERLANAAR